MPIAFGQAPLSLRNWIVGERNAGATPCSAAPYVGSPSRSPRSWSPRTRTPPLALHSLPELPGSDTHKSSYGFPTSPTRCRCPVLSTGLPVERQASMALLVLSIDPPA